MIPVERNIVQYRGIYKEFEFVVQGDISNDEIYFTSKETKDVTDDRLVDLSNTAGGGSDSEITAVAANGFTVVTVKIPGDNTADLSNEYLHYDLIGVNSSGKKYAMFYGKHYLTASVRTDFDGMSSLPSTSSRLILFDLSLSNVGDSFYVEEIAGVKTLVNYSKTEAKTYLDIDDAEMNISYLLLSQPNFFNIENPMNL